MGIRILFENVENTQLGPNKVLLKHDTRNIYWYIYIGPEYFPAGFAHIDQMGKASQRGLSLSLWAQPKLQKVTSVFRGILGIMEAQLRPLP